VAPRVIELGDRAVRDGRPVALVTEADAIEKRSLAPGAEARAPVALEHGEAVLRGRAVRSQILDALELSEVASEIPTHEIARVPF
jgi:hypothetical protein